LHERRFRTLEAQRLQVPADNLRRVGEHSLHDGITLEELLSHPNVLGALAGKEKHRVRHVTRAPRLAANTRRPEQSSPRPTTVPRRSPRIPCAGYASGPRSRSDGPSSAESMPSR